MFLNILLLKLHFQMSGLVNRELQIGASQQVGSGQWRGLPGTSEELFHFGDINAVADQSSIRCNGLSNRDEFSFIVHNGPTAVA